MNWKQSAALLLASVVTALLLLSPVLFVMHELSASGVSLVEVVTGRTVE